MRYSVCIYGLYVCVTALFAYYGLSAEGMSILAILMFLDVVFGIGKAYVLQSDNTRFSSHKLKVGVMAKLAILVLIVMLAVVLGRITKIEEVTIVVIDVSLGLFVVAEFISVLQNVMMIKLRKQIQEWDAVTAVLTFILEKMKRLIDEKISH